MANHIALKRSLQLQKSIIRVNLLQQFKRPLSVTKLSSAEAINYENIKPFEEVPGPRCYPLVGNLPTILTHKDGNPKRIHIFWEAMTKEYGNIIKFRIPMIPCFVFISDPDDIDSMYKATMDNPVRMGFFSLQKVRREAANNFFENKTGLLPENRDEWWRVRSRVQTPMMKPSNIVKYLPKVDQVALEFTDIIADLQALHGEMPENFVQELYKWALESLGLVALNRRMGCFDPNISPDSEQMNLISNAKTIFEALSETEHSVPLWKIYPTKSYRRLKEAHQIFLDIVLKNIKTTEDELLQKLEAGATSHELTLLEVLLQTEGLTRKDVMTMMLDLFFAGIDTTTHSLAFTFYCLARNPAAQKRLQQELDEVLGDGKQPLTANHMARLSYTKYCIKESMRLYPTVLGSARTLDKDLVIKGYRIPKETQVVALQSISSQDEKYFPRADEYLPERWGRDKPLGPIHPFASVPFSHGTRMCIGRRIAEQEMFTLLARVMHRFNIDYKYEDIEIVTALISGPSRPLKFQFNERKPKQ